MDDSILVWCNETELIEIARRQGLGRLRRGMDRLTLINLVRGEIDVAQEHLAGTTDSRTRLERHIWSHIDIVRSQLPGCDGHCTKYPCSEGRHALCFGGNEDTVT